MFRRDWGGGCPRHAQGQHRESRYGPSWFRSVCPVKWHSTGVRWRLVRASFPGERVACSLHLNPQGLCHRCQPPALWRGHWKAEHLRLTSHIFLDQGCPCSVSLCLCQEGRHVRKPEAVWTSCPEYTEAATLPPADPPSHGAPSWDSLGNPCAPLS